MTWVQSPTEAKDFSSGLCIQTGCETHPAFCPMGPRGKAQPGHDTDHSPLSSTKVKNEEQLYAFSPKHLHGFTFIFLYTTSFQINGARKKYSVLVCVGCHFLGILSHIFRACLIYQMLQCLLPS